MTEERFKEIYTLLRGLSENLGSISTTESHMIEWNHNRYQKPIDEISFYKTLENINVLSCSAHDLMEEYKPKKKRRLWG